MNNRTRMRYKAAHMILRAKIKDEPSPSRFYVAHGEYGATCFRIALSNAKVVFS